MIDCTIKDIKFAASLIGNKALPSKVKELSKESSYNCWGFTAYALSLHTKLTWLGSHAMDSILKNQTIKIKKKDLKAGDIAVYRCDCCPNDSLQHTAIVLNPNTTTIIHKDGGRPLEMNKIYDVWYAEHYGKKGVTFRRVKRVA